jgi:hypothetical protein
VVHCPLAADPWRQSDRAREFTKSLISNRTILSLDQTGRRAHPVVNLPPELKHVRVWTTSQGTGKAERKILAVFNLDDSPVTLRATWRQLGLDAR